MTILSFNNVGSHTAVTTALFSSSFPGNLVRAGKKQIPVSCFTLQPPPRNFIPSENYFVSEYRRLVPYYCHFVPVYMLFVPFVLLLEYIQLFFLIPVLLSMYTKSQ